MTDLLRWTLLVIGGVLALGSALSISRSPHWAVRLWDFPRVQIAALLAACGAGYLAVGWGGQPWEWIWLAAVGIAFAWQLRWILPYTPLAPTAVQRSGGRGGPRLRLLFVNVLMENQEHGRLLKVVRDAEPDLVLAVEVDRAWERALEPLEADFPHSVRQVQDNYYGMVLLSRRPLHATRIDFLVQDDIPSLYAEAEIEGGARVVVHGLHPRPPEPIRDQSSAPRDAELVVVGRAIGESSDRPTLVAGDLNDVAWSHTTALFVKLSGLLDPRLGRGFFNSFHAGNPVLRWPLDHVFHSAHFRLVELRRMPPIGSDHFPMLVELALDPDARATQEEPERDADDEQEAGEHLDRQASDAAEGKDRPGRP